MYRGTKRAGIIVLLRPCVTISPKKLFSRENSRRKFTAVKNNNMRKRRRQAAFAQQQAFKRGRIAAQKKGRLAGPGQELKLHDLDVDDAGIAANGTIVEDSVLTIAQGTTESQRVGRKVVVKAIGWRFAIIINEKTSGAATSDIVRVILYLDKQTNGAAATVTAILESDDYQSFNQLANKSRFRTLMDRTYEIHSLAGSGRGSTDTLNYGENMLQDTFFKNVNIPIEYDNSVTTGAITSMRSNNIGVLLLSREGSALFDSKMRIRFSDG